MARTLRFRGVIRVFDPAAEFAWDEGWVDDGGLTGCGLVMVLPGSALIEVFIQSAQSRKFSPLTCELRFIDLTFAVATEQLAVLASAGPANDDAIRATRTVAAKIMRRERRRAFRGIDKGYEHSANRAKVVHRRRIRLIEPCLKCKQDPIY